MFFDTVLTKNEMCYAELALKSAGRGLSPRKVGKQFCESRSRILEETKKMLRQMFYGKCLNMINSSITCEEYEGKYKGKNI